MHQKIKSQIKKALCKVFFLQVYYDAMVFFVG